MPNIDEIKQLLLQGFSAFEAIVVRPNSAFTKVERERKFVFPVLVTYAAYLVAYALFYTYKPADFPAEAAQAGLEKIPVMAWFFTEMLWGTFFTVSWVFFLSVFDGLASRLSIAKFIPSAFGITAVSAIALLLFQSGEVTSKLLFGLLFLLIIGGAWFFTAQKDFPYFRLTLLFILANSVNILLVLPLMVCTLFRWENGYMASQLLWGLWLLVLCTMGVKKLRGLSHARALLALLFALGMNFLLIFSLFMLGLISKETLKIFFVS